MKKLFLFAVALLGLAALSSCNKNESSPELVTYEVSVDASLDAPDTKALSQQGGRILVPFWGNGDEAAVYQGSTQIGTLKPNGYGQTTILKGSVTASGLSAGTELRLLAPRSNWLYSNQNGDFTTVAKYSYAVATIS